MKNIKYKKMLSKMNEVLISIYILKYQNLNVFIIVQNLFWNHTKRPSFAITEWKV